MFIQVVTPLLKSFCPPLKPMNINYLISVVCLILWIVALVDCIKSNNSNKVAWILVIILVPFLGSILYLLFGRGRA